MHHIASFPLISTQSTHPSWDATAVLGELNWDTHISIHAPLTGCDALRHGMLPKKIDFNPRTPHGMRQNEQLQEKLEKEFQSTHPSRDATRDFDCPDDSEAISIHAPLTGCDEADHA
ncbi:hypothetical protein [Cohnella fermenti]|uniref:hypothetical protein n=1 Tax=Cohnella fermenti TaxID=2565925 RepID=UPI0038B3AFF4